MNDPCHSSCTRCSKCEPSIISQEEHIILLVWPPLGHSSGKLRDYLSQSQIEFETLNSQCLKVTLQHSQTHSQIDEFVEDLQHLMTALECSDTQILQLNNDHEPTLDDIPRTITLSRFFALARGNWLVEMLQQNRLVSAFQPIVSAWDTSSLFAQEALLRGVLENGDLVPPSRLFGTARATGLLFQLDNAARHCAIHAAGRYNFNECLFINFNPTSIYDPDYCLRSTVKAIQNTHLNPSQIIFEIVESDQNSDINHLRKITDFYRNAGFRIALDDMGAGYSSLNLIHQLRPDFLKLDMELIRDVHRDPYKAMIVSKILEITRELEIKTVAEGIESEEELNWARINGATYVQGFLIARPSEVPLREINQIGEKSLGFAID